MDDVGSLLAEAAAEVSPRGRQGTTQRGVDRAGGEPSVADTMAGLGTRPALASNKPPLKDETGMRKEFMSGMDMLKQAATTAEAEERDDSTHAFRSASNIVSKSIEQEYDDAFEDEKKDNDSEVGEALGRISEDIHNNKIEFDGGDIDRALMEAAAELDEPQAYPSSPDSSDDEDPGDEERNRELIFATVQNDEKSVRWLLKHGASYCCRDSHGWTPLHWAANKGNDDIMALLLDEAGGGRLRKYVNKKDSLSGWTALHVSITPG